MGPLNLIGPEILSLWLQLSRSVFYFTHVRFRFVKIRCTWRLELAWCLRRQYEWALLTRVFENWFVIVLRLVCFSSLFIFVNFVTFELLNRHLDHTLGVSRCFRLDRLSQQQRLKWCKVSFLFSGLQIKIVRGVRIRRAIQIRHNNRTAWFLRWIFGQAHFRRNIRREVFLVWASLLNR